MYPKIQYAKPKDKKDKAKKEEKKFSKLSKYFGKK